MSTVHACRCGTGADPSPAHGERLSVNVDERAKAPCRCGPVITAGGPGVDEHRHWSVVEWGLAEPTVAASRPRETKPPA